MGVERAKVLLNYPEQGVMEHVHGKQEPHYQAQKLRDRGSGGTAVILASVQL